MKFTDEIVSVAARLGRLDDLKDLEADVATHDKYFIAKTTLSEELDGVTDPKILFGNNGLHFTQQLLFRSRSLVEGSITNINNHNILSSLACTRAHYETTGKASFFLKRLRSYYEGNIDFATMDKDLHRLFFGAKTFQIEVVPDPIQVMNLIDSVDDYMEKHLLPNDLEKKKFRSLYDALSDFCHPNFYGITCGSEINGSERAVIFREIGSMSDINFPMFFLLNMSSRLFLHFYEEIINLLKQRETMPVIHLSRDKNT